jgi:hypothetical protein
MSKFTSVLASPTMAKRVSRRSLLKSMAVAGSGLFLMRTNVCQAQESRRTPGLIYKFVNYTSGAFADDQCFWSLNGGRDWQSFAKEPTVFCPVGNGRVYFRLGAAPKNLDDRQAYWDFIEYANGGGKWNGNTTQVDAFCIPMTIELGQKKLGIAESRRKLFETFRRDAPKEFQPCAKSDFFILSPCRAGFGKDDPNGKYFDKYVAAVWSMYAKEKETPSGQWTGKVVDGALIYTPVNGGKPLRCARKPSTQEIFLGSGVLGSNPQFCAAINRHVLADPADWRIPAKFYQGEPCNWYSRFFHEHSLDRKAYGFCYDDVCEQAAFFSGNGQAVIVTLNWDRKSPPQYPHED